MSRLRKLVDRANELWAPQERPFTSRLPLLGPIIVLIRTAWNSVSTRWYVRPILEQQTAFNATVVQVINEVAAALERLEAQQAALGDQMGGLRAQSEQFTQQASAHLAQMEQSLNERLENLGASLANQIREAEEWMMANDRTSTAQARELASLSHRLNDLNGRLPGELAILRERVREIGEALRQGATEEG